MIAVWEDVKGLVIEPRNALQAILARRTLALPVILGVAGYYARTLLVSEAVFAPLGGPPAFLLGNCLLALGWTALVVTLVWLGATLTGPRGGGWIELFALWGYTQVPALVLAVLTGATILLVPSARPRDLGVGWLALGIAVTFLLSLWGLLLKLHAVRVWSGRSGWPFARMIAAVVVLYGALAWVEQTAAVERRVVSPQAVQAMEPTVTPFVLRAGAVMLPFDRLAYLVRSPRRGEIASFVSADGAGFWSSIVQTHARRLGRIVGVPGDTVEVRNGQVILNGRPFDESYRVGDARWSVASTSVGPDHYFILGDNRELPPEVYQGGIVGAERLRGRLTEVGRTRWEFAVGKGRW